MINEPGGRDASDVLIARNRCGLIADLATDRVANGIANQRRKFEIDSEERVVREFAAALSRRVQKVTYASVFLLEVVFKDVFNLPTMSPANLKDG